VNRKTFALILLALVVAAVALFLLTTSTYRVLSDDEIDPTLRSQMHRNDLAVLNALRDEQYDAVMSLVSPTAELEKTKQELPEIRAKMGKLIGSASFETFHDHYVTGLPGTNQTTLVMSAHALSEDSGAYVIHQNTDTESSYISLLTSEAGPTEILYTIIWGKYDEGWRIRSLSIAMLGWNGKRGPAWLEEIKRVRATSGDVAAYLTFKAVAGLIHPSAAFEWKGLEDRATALYQELAKSIDPMFSKPIVVQELDSRPTIYGIDATTVDDLPGQVIPVIHYVSKYPNSQADLIREEAHQMAPYLETYFKGITSLGKNILFTAYEEPPTDPKMQHAVFRTVVEID